MGTRCACALEETLVLDQNAAQIIELVKNPQCFDPRTDLNRGGAMLHSPERSCTDAKALREYGHGVVTRQTPGLEAGSEFGQVLLLLFNIQNNVY